MNEYDDEPTISKFMNTSHDEYGTVDVDALMAVHNENMLKVIDAISQHMNEYDDEPTISTCSDTVTDENSQECVGDVILAPNDTISVQKGTNPTRTAIWGVYNISKKTKQGTKGNTRGLFHRRSYADVVAAPA